MTGRVFEILKDHQIGRIDIFGKEFSPEDIAPLKGSGVVARISEQPNYPASAYDGLPVQFSTYGAWELKRKNQEKQGADDTESELAEPREESVEPENDVDEAAGE